MIAGIGVDVVDLARFDRALDRTPALRDRLFAESERGRGRASLAARFAAKEALIKALGGPDGWSWTDAVVVSDDAGVPSFRLSGALAATAARRGIRALHLSMSHDGGIATAFVVAEQDDS